LNKHTTCKQKADHSF